MPRCRRVEGEQVRAGEHRGGLAVDVHERRARLLQHRRGAADRLALADHRQRRRHVAADRVLRAGPAADQGVEQVALGDRPGDLGGHQRRLLLDHGQLRDVVLAQQRDRLRHGLVRVDVDERGQVGSAWRRAGPRRSGPAVWVAQEAVVGHPVVVEDLRQVAAAAVGEHDDDDVVAAPAVAATRSAATTASPPEPPTSSASSRASRRVMRERVGVAHRDHLVGDRPGRRWSARCPRRRPPPGRGGRSRRSRREPSGSAPMIWTRLPDTSLR